MLIILASALIILMALVPNANILSLREKKVTDAQSGKKDVIMFFGVLTKI